MSKVLFLGFPASGKTVLLGALANWLSGLDASRVAFYPHTEEAHLFSLTVPRNLRDGFWPEQTSHAEVSCLGWDLTLDDRLLTEVEFLDYPGEAFLAYAERGTPRENAERMKLCAQSLSKLDAFIGQSDALFLLIDYARLYSLSERCRAPVSSQEAVVKRGVATREFIANVWNVVSVVGTLLKLEQHPSVTIVLTQNDRYPEIADAGAALRELDPMLGKILRQCTVLSVSAVGKTQVVKEDDGGRCVPIPGAEPVGMYELLYQILRSSGSAKQHMDDLERGIRELQNADTAQEGVRSHYMGTLLKFLPFCPPHIRKQVEDMQEKIDKGALPCVWDEAIENIQSEARCEEESSCSEVPRFRSVGFWDSVETNKVPDWTQRAEQLDRQGTSYFKGEGGERSYEKAVEYYTRAANLNNVHAQLMLGRCYQTGYGVYQSEEEAITWYRRAAEGGSIEAGNLLKKLEH